MDGVNVKEYVPPGEVFGSAAGSYILNPSMKLLDVKLQILFLRATE